MQSQFSNNFSFILQIAKFDVAPDAVYPVVIFGTLLYLFAVVCNITILVLIVTQPKLHKPMFYIMFSLPFLDLIGITVSLPRVLVDMVTQANTVYYPTCILQSFLLHMYGGGVLFVLAAMSVDRYIAICHPLRYNAIMTSYTVCGIMALAWGGDFALIVGLFILHANLYKCKTVIFTVYCNHTALIRLACGDVTINNIYGLFVTGCLQGVSLAIQLFCYSLILRACIYNSKNRSKALNTCLAQLIIFTLYEIITAFTIVSYRFDTIPVNVQKISGLMIYAALPVINPILYGMKTKDVRNTFLIVLKKKTKEFIHVT